MLNGKQLAIMRWMEDASRAVQLHAHAPNPDTRPQKCLVTKGIKGDSGLLRGICICTKGKHPDTEDHEWSPEYT